MVESVTATVKRYSPGVVGTPETIPLWARSLSPGGSCPPARRHEYGVNPPVTTSGKLTFDPATTVLEDGTEMASVAGWSPAGACPNAAAQFANSTTTSPDVARNTRITKHYRGLSVAVMNWTLACETESCSQPGRAVKRPEQPQHK